METILTGLRIFGAGNCIDTVFWGQVCDSCNGSAILKIMSFVIELLGYGIGIVGIIAITVVGTQYLTASGSPEKAMKARMRFVNMAIGLVVYVAIFGIFNFLMPMGKLGMSVLVASEEVCPEKTATTIQVDYPIDEELYARGTTPSAGSTQLSVTAADKPITPLNADSTDIGCDPRTKFSRIATDAYYRGKKHSINLCKVAEISGQNEVNSRVSGAFAALAKARVDTGSGKLRSSGTYRTMAKQQELYSRYGSKRAARPGYSNHQMGYAIDFAISADSQPKFSTCNSTSRFTTSTDPFGSGKNRWFYSSLSKWFCDYSANFGLYRNVHNEPWHMDPDH